MTTENRNTEIKSVTANGMQKVLDEQLQLMYTENDEELDALYREEFSLTFKGHEMRISWGAEEYNTISAFLEELAKTEVQYKINGKYEDTNSYIINWMDSNGKMNSEEFNGTAGDVMDRAKDIIGETKTQFLNVVELGYSNGNKIIYTYNG